MPQKLQVDESFAFLFMCIEASGCKLDYKLIGEATDLNPAAARMRYTRLKKAVETGLFKGATLSSKPTTTSPQLAALANPESRRLGNAAATGRTQKPRRATRPRRNAQAKASASEDEDEEEEEEGEEEEGGVRETDAQPSSIGGRLRRKRQASNIVPEDDDSEMFYADTSRATRRTKQVKRSDSDIEAEEQEEEIEEVEEPEQQDNVASGPTTSHHRRGRGGSVARSPRSRSQDFDDAAFAGSSSRRKASAANAAESAYAVGIASGRYAPSPEDVSDAQIGRAARLRNISTGATSFANSGRKTPVISSAGMRQLNARDRQFLARHGQASQPKFSPSLVHTNQFDNFVPATGSRSPTFGQNNTGAGRMPPPSPSPFEDRDVQAESDNLRPHHTYDAASVFDNFMPPMDVATRFGPSSTKPSPAKRNTSKAHKRTQQNHAVANIDPQLMATSTSASPLSSSRRGIQSRQIPRATTTIPENAQTKAEGPTEMKVSSPQTDNNSRMLRPRSAVPSVTASELEIAEMLQGLKQGSVARAKSAVSPAPAPASAHPVVTAGTNSINGKPSTAISLAS
ncbi:hypothetical protein LTR70_004053 [Exophiala xenobiotica]|uniref:Myb-like DNA-binding domain-containing protein n=1 Tax=Lithohypha guttulata TaxID=1690604 RepID=A0ABR0KEM7_9EURO|nr:hypothetical protein LTR24_003503 [Lithohypha guttulata]KAK5321663.1 hypothetical protein LTR70_004053 [Exophiala xenobiotica]